MQIQGKAALVTGAGQGSGPGGVPVRAVAQRGPARHALRKPPVVECEPHDVDVDVLVIDGRILDPDDHVAGAEVVEGQLVEARDDAALDFVDAVGAERSHGNSG